MDKTELPKIVIATCLSSSSKNGSKYCKNCYKQRHLLFECPIVQCRYCHKICHIVYNCPTKPPKPGQSGILPRPGNHSIIAAATKESLSTPSPSSVSVSELGPLLFFMVKQFLSTSGKVSFAVSGTSQQNGRAEHKHCHILDSVRAFLLSASCPERFWGEAALTAVYTINRFPSSVLQNVSPFERLYGTPSSYSSLRVFGCACFVLLQPHEHSKLEPRSRLCCFLGYGNEHKDPSPILPIPPADSPVSPVAHPLVVDPVLDQTPNLPPTAPIAPPPVVDPVLDQTPDLPLAAPLAASLISPQEPAPLVDLVTDQTPPPPFVDLTGCKWVYKIKTKSDGTIERYKARLVDKGYAQEYGIDYEETFASVARITSVRSLLTIATVHQWPLFQMDIKNAFLNGDLTKEVYMQAPLGYSECPDKVCLLCRALYGLKQAPRAWFGKFSSIVHQFGFSSSPHDTTLFIRRSDKGMILLLLYVDDMIITGDDHSSISDFKQLLYQHFEMKDLGHLSYFLGLEVPSNSTGYYLSQAKYASDLLSCAVLIDTKAVFTPLEMNARFTPLDGTPLSDATLYRQLVGSLVYLTVTRPDIAHVFHLVSQFLVAPHSTHYAAVIHILRYIKGTMFHGLHFSAHSTIDLCTYSNAYWVGDLTDRRSTSGCCFFLRDSLIS
uniref:Uncharacterized protein n=1 Tax=Fagus sylvatica TaxID=28930 RepID=A0A2N9HM45_FAGSY